MPESVARTITPIVTRRTVITTVARASFWNRVTARPFYVAAAFGHYGYPPLYAPHAPSVRPRRHAARRRLRQHHADHARRVIGGTGGLVRPVDGERDPGHRELAPGPGPQPVRVLVPRPREERPGRLPGPHGLGLVHRPRRDDARTGDGGDVRVGDRGRAWRLRRER